jgi:DNA-binding protein H-NS
MTSKELKKKRDELEKLAKEIAELERIENMRLKHDSHEILDLATRIKNLAESHYMKPVEIIEMLAQEFKTTRKKSLVEPKYYNPNNPDEKWTGRGRKPLWVIELTSSGRSLEDFKI